MPSPLTHTQSDPFRALESDLEARRAWQVGRNAATYLALLDPRGFEELRAVIAVHLARVSVTAPVRRSDHWFPRHPQYDVNREAIVRSDGTVRERAAATLSGSR